MTKKPILYYVHDPMCSWCWAFQKVWPTVFSTFEDSLEVEYLAGGLAPDSNEPMPQEMQNTIASYWKNIQRKVPGTEFNFDFWQQCQPRRSTYPACRAVLAIKQIDSTKEHLMINEIQKAYYLKAENPSDVKTLINCAKRIGVEEQNFKNVLTSKVVDSLFIKQMSLARSMQANGFPSLILRMDKTILPIYIDYNDANVMVEQIKKSVDLST